MLATLVASPSVSSTRSDLDQSNHQVVAHLSTWLTDLGFATELQELPDQPGKFNLIATLGSGEDGLMLAGHTDTVPCDAELWDADPFRLREADDCFFGLGVCDMKGFFPIALEAVRQLDRAQLKKPLVLLATADEECTMAGARALVQRGLPAVRHALIGEPTNLVPVRMHKGMMVERIVVQGRSGHSSDPSLGHNALETMHKVMAEILLFRQQLAAQHQHPGFAISTPTMNLGCLHAGDNPNRICGQAALEIDLRLLPGMDSDAVHEQLCARLKQIDDAALIDISRPCLPVPPFELPADCPFVHTIANLTGSEPGAAAFGTEAPFYAQMGMDAVVLGPGDIDQAHQPNEYLARTRISPMVGMLSKLIAELCIR